MEGADRAFWWSLQQQVWEQHLLCASKDEAASKAVCFIDMTIGNLLVQHVDRRDLRFAMLVLLSVGIKEFYDPWRLSLPAEFGRPLSKWPDWNRHGVWVAHDRLRYWADRATRFRDRPLEPPATTRATGA